MKKVSELGFLNILSNLSNPSILIIPIVPSYVPSLAGRVRVGPLHTALCAEGGGYGRKDGDEDVEDFSPGGVVVESSHSVKVGLRLVIYQRDGTRFN